MYKTWSDCFLEGLSRFGELTGAGRLYRLTLSEAPLWPAAAEYLRTEGAVEYFLALTATHKPPHFVLRYDLRSLLYLTDIAVLFSVGEEEAAPSVAHIWPAANWQEREAYDLVGVRFAGHPDLRRILLPEDWEGHPLQQNYSFPSQYHAISLRFEPPNASV